MSKMPEMYRGDPPTEKLWRAAQRWIALNKQALITALDVPKIMQLLEAAGALELPEDAPLPAIIWPPEGSPLLNLAEAVTEVTARKPMGIEQGIIEQVRRQIGKP